MNVVSCSNCKVIEKILPASLERVSNLLDIPSPVKEIMSKTVILKKPIEEAFRISPIAKDELTVPSTEKSILTTEVPITTTTLATKPTELSTTKETTSTTTQTETTSITPKLTETTSTSVAPAFTEKPSTATTPLTSSEPSTIQPSTTHLPSSSTEDLVLTTTTTEKSTTIINSYKREATLVPKPKIQNRENKALRLDEVIKTPKPLISTPSLLNSMNHLLHDLLYKFNYTTTYHGHNEEGSRDGNKKGSYFVIGRDNIRRTVEYLADENGFVPHVVYEKVDNGNAVPNQENDKNEVLQGSEFKWFNIIE